VSGRMLYLAGAAAVAAIGLAILLLISPAARPEVAWGLGIAIGLQAPLGWWTVRSIGAPRFQLVWSAGMMIRLAIVALVALVIAPAYRLEIEPLLGTLVGGMMALLMVEALTAMREHTWDRG
jgi:heme A synthase